MGIFFHNSCPKMTVMAVLEEYDCNKLKSNKRKIDVSDPIGGGASHK
jgi:hypothetical protein